ncbi:hypothetical protein CDD80_3338 [Ophiocordyceps camponoti-rufipedis]|uniref:Peptidase S8/S53 domain-containing protein n=1 Tax=Ophiocordyceps camponoti-rufipedis TaxID=2004952 RepID=A0A2C5Z236_9HYPO|nr:hypothetical protein CDD80_3338 [Ophiocordyceps camponoti-rufipedis]
MRLSLYPTELLALGLSAILHNSNGDGQTTQAERAPLHMAVNRAAVIPGNYIVRFKHETPISVSEEILKTVGAKADYVYNGKSHAWGFAGDLSGPETEVLRNNKHVKAIEENAEVLLHGSFAQREAQWNLVRISHNTTSNDGAYLYDSSAGEGTCSYVIDSGIVDTDPEFGRRAKQLKSFIEGEETDDVGHGTHVAGIIGSNYFGVAKKTQLYGVKVFNSKSRSSTAMLLSGIWYVLDDMDGRRCPKGVIVNLSVGGDKSEAINDAALELVKKGAFVVASAGNERRDACQVSPASAEHVCTVGGIDKSNRLFWKDKLESNHGPCIDVFAPGDDIKSLSHQGHRWATMSGTSQAAAHVAGLGAYLAALEGITGNQTMCNRIQELATKDAIADLPTKTPNLIAYNGVDKLVKSVDDVSIKSAVTLCRKNVFRPGERKVCEGLEATPGTCSLMPIDFSLEVSSLQPSKAAGTCRFFVDSDCRGDDSFPAFHDAGVIKFDGENIDGMDVFYTIGSFQCDGELRPQVPQSSSKRWAWSMETQRAICSHFDEVRFDFRVKEGATTDKLAISFSGADGSWQAITSGSSNDSSQWPTLDLKTMFNTDKVEVGRLRRMLVSGNITQPDGGKPWSMDGVRFRARCAESGLQVFNDKFSDNRALFSAAAWERTRLYYVTDVVWTGPEDWKPKAPCSHLTSLNIQLKISDDPDVDTRGDITVWFHNHRIKIADGARPGDVFTVPAGPQVDEQHVIDRGCGRLYVHDGRLSRGAIGSCSISFALLGTGSMSVVTASADVNPVAVHDGQRASTALEPFEEQHTPAEDANDDQDEETPEDSQANALNTLVGRQDFKCNTGSRRGQTCNAIKCRGALYCMNRRGRCVWSVTTRRRPYGCRACYCMKTSTT